MQYGYLIKISNRNLYKEIQLPYDITNMKIGTGLDCDVRFYKEAFFDDFKMIFVNIKGQWQVSCTDNIYIDCGDVRKLVNKKLVHGDNFRVKYQRSEGELFKVDFVIDFDNEIKDYTRVIGVTNINGFIIGGNSNCNIVINSQYAANDLVEFRVQNNSLVANVRNSQYGFYHNGKLAETGEIINNKDFFSIANYSFYFNNGTLCTSKSVFVNGLSYYDDLKGKNYPRFYRNSRLKTIVGQEKIEILDPPAKPQKPKNNLFLTLLPSIAMIAVGAATAVTNPFMLISSAVGVITAVISVIQSKKEYQTNSVERVNKYNTYIENKRQEIAEKRSIECKELSDIYIDFDVEQKYFSEFSSNLFERTRNDDDFLCVRFGTGDLEAKREIDFKKQEKLEVEDDLQIKPEELSKEFKYVHNAPIYCDLKSINALGIVGNESYRYEIMKNMIVDICARQFQSDVKMFFVAAKENKDKVYWLRMLPHVYNDSIEVRNIVCDDESKNVLFEYLFKELTFREQNKSYDNNIVVFLYNEYGFQNHPVSRFVDKAKELGVTFVFFGDTVADVGQGCGYLVSACDEKTAVLIDTKDINKSHQFVYTAIPDNQAKNIVELLAPVYTEEISLESSLIKNISLFKMLNILSVDDLDLSKNWASSQVFKSMSAPIGVSKSGIVYLDLHDKAHGPHGLVAGTTGSGKSEILQTYILSMSILYHPYEVGFVIIDFKGGGMVNQFRNLPHLVGAITNIDGKEIDRSLKSIKAELNKRQRLFAEADVNHIDKYIKKFKSGEVSEPLPHLILIVDEFAELKADQPEFMKELISAARIGRSLGVHLILATQKPSGQVDDQIWSNSRFKLCLKVQDQADSNEVLKSPLAAEIKEPGRAYLQVGNNEIFELFQSAYSGAPEKASDTDVKEFSIYSLTESGKKKTVYTKKKEKSEESNVTQLDAVVNYIYNYSKSKKITKLPSICLTSLPNVILQPESIELKNNMVDIGIYDDPDNQIQEKTYVDFDNKNTLIIGSSQYGKTNLLQSIIKSIALKTTSKQSVFYILDFASMVLKNFEILNHVGGVVTSSEDEKLKNLFKLLFEEINSRKEKLLSVGVSSYSSYLEAGYTDLPHIYVIVDNLTALNELYLEDDDSLLMIIREGISLGISTIVANAQTAGVGYKYLSNFANKIVMYCNDSNEYTNVFDHVTVKPDEKPGRCILEIEKRLLECQTYLAFEGKKEIDRVKQMHEFIAAVNEENKDNRARQIPFIPKVLTQDILENEFNAKVINYNIPVGLTYNGVKPFYLNLYQLGALGITGKENFGHRNFVSYVLNNVLNLSNKADIVIFDDISRKYSQYKDKVSRYSLGTDGIIDIINNWHEKLDKRYEKMLVDGQIPDDSELLLMVIQNNDVAQKIQDDYDVADKFNDIVGRYKNLGVCILFANYPNSMLSFDAPDALKVVKQEQHIICLEDLSNLKCIDPPYDAIRENKKPVTKGDGYYINNNDVEKIKFVLSE